MTTDEATQAKCPVCGSPSLKVGEAVVSYEFMGERAEFSHIHGDVCTACNEVIIDKINADLYTAAAKAFKAEVRNKKLGQ